MSSAEYACDLEIDRRLRLAVIGGGLLAWLVGGWLAFGLPLPAPLRAVVLVLWTAVTLHELRGQRRSLCRIDRIRITSGGRIEGLAADGRRFPLELLPGSVVLGGGAWLRLRFADGAVTGEWLMPAGGDREQWRTLQVLWRQRGARFGRPRRS